MCTKNECINILTEATPYIQKNFGVESMCLFGSVARGENRIDSDVDILVEMPPKIFKISALKEYLESLLKTSVDLIRRHPHLSQKFINQISRDAITIL